MGKWYDHQESQPVPNLSPEYTICSLAETFDDSLVSPITKKNSPTSTWRWLLVHLIESPEASLSPKVFTCMTIRLHQTLQLVLTLVQTIWCWHLVQTIGADNGADIGACSRVTRGENVSPIRENMFDNVWQHNYKFSRHCLANSLSHNNVLHIALHKITQNITKHSILKQQWWFIGEVNSGWTQHVSPPLYHPTSPSVVNQKTRIQCVFTRVSCTSILVYQSSPVTTYQYSSI